MSDKSYIDEALDLRQRIKRARSARKNKMKLARGRKLAKRRPITREKIDKVTRRKARGAVFTFFSKGRTRDEMSPSEMQRIEKKVDNAPSLIKRRVIQMRKGVAKELKDRKNRLNKKSMVKESLLSFSSFIAEQLVNDVDSITIGWTKLNPPSNEHRKYVNAIAEGHSNYRIYVSALQNDNNSMLYESKIKYFRKMVPRHARNIISESRIRTIIDALVDIYEEDKYKTVNIAVPNSQLYEMRALVEKFNGVKQRAGYYFFEDLNVIPVVNTNPDDVSIKLQEAAKENDFRAFAKHMPITYEESRSLFEDLQGSMGIVLEEQNFKVDDRVVLKEDTTDKFLVSYVGPNYCILENLETGKRVRKWHKDIIKKKK